MNQYNVCTHVVYDTSINTIEKVDLFSYKIMYTYFQNVISRFQYPHTLIIQEEAVNFKDK